MFLSFADRDREGFVQGVNKGGVKLYIHGVGFVVIKEEQLRKIKVSHGKEKRRQEKRQHKNKVKIHYLDDWRKRSKKEAL
jgi:hypothetical protein